MISLRKSWTNLPVNRGTLSSGLRRHDLFTFGNLRNLLSSFNWPSAFYYVEESPHIMWMPEGPDNAWNGEGQSLTNDGTFWYLTTAQAIWYYGPGTRKPAVPTSQEAEVETKGLVFRGRRQLDRDVDTADADRHMGAGALIGKLLILPVEGGRRSAHLGEWEPASQMRLWAWVFDTDSLGYLGRISVPTAIDSFPWCAITPDGQYLYTSRFGDGSDWVSDVEVFRLPDLSLFSGPPSEKMAMEAIDDDDHASVPRFPSLNAEFVGRLPLMDLDGSPILMGNVQGGCISPNWHLYIAFERLQKDTNILLPNLGLGSTDVDKYFTAWTRGAVGFDLLTGRGVTWISSDRGDELESIFVEPGGAHFLHIDNRRGSPGAGRRFTVSHFAVKDEERGLP